MSLRSFLIRNRIRFQGTLMYFTLGLLLVSLNRWETLAPLFEHTLSLLGWTLISIGVLGRVWAGSLICGHKTVDLVTDGPYSMCRNPLYLFSFIGGLGVMFTTETLAFPLLFGIFFLTYYTSVIRREEAVLVQHHGSDFERYCARVPRFWPSLRAYSEPAEYSVSAAKFRKHIGEAGWFVVAGGVIEFIEGLHISGYLPTLLHVF